MDANSDSPLERWIWKLKATKGSNVASVALANKMARILYVLLSRDTEYKAAKAA